MEKLLTLAAAAGDAYDPAAFAADLAAGAPTILGWVGAGVGGGVVVMLALIGIRRGLAAFRGSAR